MVYLAYWEQKIYSPQNDQKYLEKFLKKSNFHNGQYYKLQMDVKDV